MTDCAHRPCGSSGASRRSALAAVGGAALTGALAACGDGTGQEPEPTRSAPTSGAPAGGGEPFARVDEVPVGGGTIFPAQSAVVTQPDEGAIAAFSSTCTHKGCIVDDVSGGTINCACHGSRFDISDGSVVSGPATDPLPQIPVTVENGEISLA